MFRVRVIGWLLFLTTLLAYLPVIQDGFLNYDDNDYVTENPVVQNGITWAGVKWAFQGVHVSNWHPLTWLSHMADCELFHLNPAGHHLTNIVFHAANAVLLFILFRRMTDAVWPSAFVAALFAWHPLHVESVAWISERKDVLSTLFELLALLAYTRYVRPQRTGGNGRNHFAPDRPEPGCSMFPHSKYFWIALAFYVLGLMSKPMVVTLPFVMVLLDYWPLRRNQNVVRLLLEKWPFLLLTVVFCVVTIVAQRQEAISPLARYSMGLRLENVVIAYAGYLLKTVWPVHLAVFYPLPKAMGWPAVAGSAAVLGLVSILVLLAARRHRCLPVGWLWYLGTLIPVIGFVQVGDQAMADRYTYFPLIGILFAVTFSMMEVAGRCQISNRLQVITAAAVLAACLALTENQLSYWRDSETLFTHALAVTKENALAHLNLGETLQEQQRRDEALAQYQAVLQLSPESYKAYNNIGRILLDEGKPEAALEYCRIAVELNPRSPSLRNSLGIVLSELGRFNEALFQYSEALRLGGDSARLHFQMARTLLKQGKDVEALARLRTALQLGPDNYQTLIFTARVLASDENSQVRNGAEALALAQRAGKLAGKEQPVALDTLAMAYAEAGHFEEAVQIGRQAVQFALAAGQPEDAAAMQQRLLLYQKHQPWRVSFAK